MDGTEYQLMLMSITFYPVALPVNEKLILHHTRVFSLDDYKYVFPHRMNTLNRRVSVLAETHIR